MKKIAFSIWMNIPGSKPLPEYISISEKTNSLLEKEGYEIALFTDPIPNNEISDLLYNSPNKQIVHKCVNFSDWLRLYKIVELLESGYDEVKKYMGDLAIPFSELADDLVEGDGKVNTYMEAFGNDAKLVGVSGNDAVIKSDNLYIYAGLNKDSVDKVRDFYSSFKF